MKFRAILALLAGATALCVLPDLPSAKAQTIQYWCYKPGTSTTRQPRTNPNGQYVSCYNKTFTQTLAPGTNVSLPISPSSPIQFDGLTYVLASTTITGGADAGITVLPTVPNLPTTVTVPLSNAPNPHITESSYYYPEGGPPCPPNQVCGTANIDEYNETAGALADDSFVEVYVPPSTTPDAGLTKSGNQLGTVSTGKSAVRINADMDPLTYPGNTPSNLYFDQWIPGIGASANGHDLNVNKGVTAYAMAYYYSCPAGFYMDTSSNVHQCLAIPSSTTPTCSNGQIWSIKLKKCVGGEHCNMKCPPGTSCAAVAFECDCICINVNNPVTHNTNTQY